MELQWPLILFTTFMAWCAGTFATQCVLAFQGKASKSQMACWITSAVLLVIGGISVFLHLQHWTRIFNGFGHITSGITQEFIIIVVLAVIAIVYLALLRRNDNQVPKWIAVLGIIASVLLVLISGHSYQMEAVPAWNTFLWPIALLGEACILGPATVAVVMALRGESDDEVKAVGGYAFIGSIVNAVCSIAAAVSVTFASNSLTQVGTWYDLTHPTQSIAAANINPFTGDPAMVMWIGVVVIGLIVPIIACIMGKQKGNWKMWAAVALIAAVIGVVCLRMVFYMTGVHVFMFY